ncbi:MAG: Diphthamide biosynthesis protein 2 [Thelocarpon impressellum]|nr:MAG: Diphthamide biosynthesis protein 2 [Thelocarpon impressellum]
MATPLGVPPVLSTPESRIFEGPTSLISDAALPRVSDEELDATYEVRRTAEDIWRGGWRKIALQFPDGMLVDAPRIFEALGRELEARARNDAAGSVDTSDPDGGPKDLSEAVERLHEDVEKVGLAGHDMSGERKLYILGDTSYGACCVDEIAAEHFDADVVVHYGRACLSPTARLPVIYVFTKHDLSHQHVIEAFKGTFPDRARKIIIVANVTFADHVLPVHELLVAEGYQNLFPTSIIHDPASPLPNRSVPGPVKEGVEDLSDYHLFHIAEPAASLLLVLTSRLASIRIYPTTGTQSDSPPHVLEASTAMALRRRYAVVTSLTTAAVFGILINTLSVKNYLHIVERVKAQIAAAGKKSYTFVVGKVNAAKLANFSEVGGWVVISCWESSLVESKDFFRPVITPFELRLALQGDHERVWTGEWLSDFNQILAEHEQKADDAGSGSPVGDEETPAERVHGGDLDCEEESEPPEFDLKTGRYVSHSRPMRNSAAESKRAANPTTKSAALIKRENGDLATVGGAVSPGAEYLRSQRTWKGLGSDFEIAYDEAGQTPDGNGASVEQGRSGVARGYRAGEESERR